MVYASKPVLLLASSQTQRALDGRKESESQAFIHSILKKKREKEKKHLRVNNSMKYLCLKEMFKRSVHYLLLYLKLYDF